MKFCHLQVNRWIWRTSSRVKLARLRRPKEPHVLPHVDYRPKTNASILWNMGHTKGRLHIAEIGQGKETKNLNVVDVLTVQK
jgi:hypothetical protein